MKSKLIILFSCLYYTIVNTNHLRAQGCPDVNISLETQEQVDSLLIKYPDCKEILGNLNIGADIENLHGLLGITHIYGGVVLQENNHLNDFIGLDSLVFIGKLKGDGVTYIAGYFFQNDPCDEPTPKYGKRKELSLFIHNNASLKNLNGLEKLTNIEGMLWIYKNSKLLHINGLSNLKSIGSGNWGYYDIENSNSHLTSNISIVIDSNATLQSIEGLNQVNDLTGALRIIDNKELEGEVLHNLHKIGTGWYYHGAPENPFDTLFQSITIRHNKNLSCLNVGFCRAITNHNYISLNNNGIDCSDKELMKFNCEYLGNILHPVFYDFNQDGEYTIDEPLLNGFNIHAEPGNFNSLTNQSNGGKIYLPTGFYEVGIDTTALDEWNVSSDSISYTIHVDSLGFMDSLFFGVYPAEQVSNMQSNIFPSNHRCNEFAKISVMAENKGTTSTSGTLWLQADANIQNIQYVDVPDTIIGDTLFGWYFANLFPRTNLIKEIEFQLPGPPDFPIGDPINYNSKVIFTDSNGKDSTSQINSALLECAYDPNDKLVAPIYPKNYALIEEALYYTIRFQNTGNAYAKHVIIQDVLDENLDANSFELINASHFDVLSASINDNAQVTFDFHEIYLPDSTENLEESQGFVTFSIRTKEGIIDQTIINNYADIYFDFNPAITTNTTTSIMVHTFDADEDGIYIWIDCDDHDAEIGVATEEIIYDGIDNDCDPNTLDDDLDQDGFTHDVDCDDQNKHVNPGMVEIAYDGIDNDCNLLTLDDDLDQDGYTHELDCDDQNEHINPDMVEIIYDGNDNDCDPLTLDDDLDQDGYTHDIDCDDQNEHINPGIQEIAYDGIDNDCDPLTLDDDLDQDGYTHDIDCDDQNEHINPGIQEIAYDGIDNDCDALTFDNDVDQDGFILEEDCDDTNPNIYPGAIEISNNAIDENCDGQDQIIESISESIMLFPNPVNDRLNVLLKELFPYNFNIQIYNMTGQRVLSTIMEGSQISINLSAFDDGLYMVEISNKEQNISHIEKIIKINK